jgi:hypothetical protein
MLDDEIGAVPLRQHADGHRLADLLGKGNPA